MAITPALILSNGRPTQVGASDTAIAPWARAKTSNGVLPYVMPGYHPKGSGPQALTANTIYYAPIWVRQSITLDQLAIEVSTLVAGSSARIGIYQSDQNLQPGALVVDAGTVATATTGVKTAAVALTLAPGNYLTALAVSAAISVRTIQSNRHGVHMRLTGGSSSAYAQLMRSAFTFGALPNPGQAWDTTDYSTTPWRAAVGLRVTSIN